MSCVSELVLETREFEMLLGQINLDGSRKVKLYIPRVSGWRLIDIIGLKWVLTKDFGNFNHAIREI